MITDLVFDYGEFVNVIISALIGLVLSYFAAYTYEKFVNKRKERNIRKAFAPFESYRDNFDWQHWDIKDGKLATKPVNSFMKIKYRSNQILDFEWIEDNPDTKPQVKGHGMLIFDDFVRGKMFFSEFDKINFGTREFVTYELLWHDGLYHMVILVNADDEGTKYAMMRQRAMQP